MKKNCVSIALITLVAFSVPVNAQVFELSSTKKSSFIINQNFPAVYKPSKLIIGNKTKFVIKAEPESRVSLVTSDENAGYPAFHGQELRLGSIVKPYEGIVGDKGILELEIPLPQEKELVGKILYFEVLVWKKSDFSDLKIAKIMGIDGSETNINAVVITEPLKNQSMPNFGPNIPGTGGDMSKAKAIFNRINDTNPADDAENYYQDEMYYKNDSLMLRNMHAPELKPETDKAP
ncbi:MAG TPA: hypothetical protein DDW90_02615 [Cyanobacteria bacterium UBA9971]|nr:hypothetical protein [Cyanobacteria bacterium UBA9971]